MGLALCPVNEANLILILPPRIIIIGINVTFGKKKFLLAMCGHIKYVFRERDVVVRSNELYWVAS